VSNIQDVGGRSAGRLFGIANTAGCLAGIAGTTAAGYILQTQGAWGTLFQTQVALYVFGAAVYVLFSSADAEF
jgi:ACS family sodium-dependent inorganic phosphate cotransporter/ACS family sodium-dependent inorganic phosphate cotransporter-like MFS transporter 9